MNSRRRRGARGNGAPPPAFPAARPASPIFGGRGTVAAVHDGVAAAQRLGRAPCLRNARARAVPTVGTALRGAGFTNLGEDRR